MGIVATELSVSLDGFVAGPNDGPDNPLGDGGQALFAWYSGGDTALPLPGTDMVFHVSRASADLLQAEWSKLGAMVTGRRMFDIAHAWGGNPPGGGPCFVATHTVPPEWAKQDSPFVFVTDGVASAVRQAQQAAGGKNVSVSSASIMQQCLKLGLMDEIQIDLAPVLLGGGVRLFDNLGPEAIQLERIAALEAPG
ncbi:MAG TPA: dihydrofolate reductase family protein, partial [Roseiflexaceae bacterium]|nr:dihydrofolate reductase family protein [Roseiflexaceae bacterium]